MNNISGEHAQLGIVQGLSIPHMIIEIDLDECEVEPCNRNGNCINVPGSFRCVCNSGYVGDGFTCIGKYR